MSDNQAYEQMTMSVLQVIAKARGIKRYSRMRKAQLIQAIRNSDATQSVHHMSPPVSPVSFYERPRPVASYPQVLNLKQPYTPWGDRYVEALAQLTARQRSQAGRADRIFLAADNEDSEGEEYAREMPLDEFFADIAFEPEWIPVSNQLREGDLIRIGESANGRDPLYFVYNRNGELWVSPFENSTHFPEEAQAYLNRHHVRTLSDVYALYGLRPENKYELNIDGLTVNGQEQYFPDPDHVSSQRYEVRGGN